MKKIILGTLVCMMALSATAQTNSKISPIVAAKYTSHVSTDDQIRQMATQLRLNEGQYIRFRDVSKARAGQIAEINSLYANDQTMRQAKTDAVNKEYDAQLAQSLSAAQFTAYLTAIGQSPAATNTNLEATGYGGRTFETGANQVNRAATTENNTQTLDNSSTNSNDNVIVEGNNVSVESDEGELKVRKKRERVKTKDMIYKADADETKLKARDGSFKAKSEKGKTKIETPEGKMKIEDGEVKLKPKGGKKVKLKE